MKRKKVLTFEQEVDRVDRLLSKWGISVGNLGGARAKRRELAVVLARDHPRVFQDVVIEALMAEARLRGLKAPQLWIYGLLSDEVERRTYLPEVLRAAARPPRMEDSGEFGASLRVHPGTLDYFRSEAQANETTASEEEHDYKRRWMYYRLIKDQWSIERIAEESRVSESECREAINIEMVTQEDKTLEEWERSRKP